MTVRRKPHNVRAGVILIAHLNELIELHGFDRVKVMKMRPNHDQKDHRRWNPEAQIIRKKLVNDSEFSRLCLLMGKSPKTVATAYWIGEALTTARQTTGLGRKLSTKPLNSKYNYKEVSARRTEQAKEGLYMEFANPQNFAKICEAVRQGESSDDIESHWQCFSKEAARQIATRHVTWLLKKFQTLKDETLGDNIQSIKDILGGVQVDKLHDVEYDRFFLMSREVAAEMAMESYERDHVAGLIFASAANVKVFYNDLVYALMNRISGVCERLDGSLCFPTMVGKVFVLDAILKVENCVGGGTAFGMEETRTITSKNDGVSIPIMSWIREKWSAVRAY